MNWGLLRQTAFVRFFGLSKVPMIFYLSPKIMKFDEESCEVKIPLNYRSKNHLGSMYFGALACGADIAGGLLAMNLILESKEKISLSFKSFEAHFLKRPHSDVLFVNKDGGKIRDLIEKTLADGERHSSLVDVVAYCPKDGPEPVAEFKLELSLRKK